MKRTRKEGCALFQVGSVTMGWTIGLRGLDSRRGLGIFLFTTASRPTLWPIQWVPGALFPGVKRPGREANHVVPRTRMCDAMPPPPNTSSWHGSQLKHKDSFNFTFTVRTFFIKALGKTTKISFRIADLRTRNRTQDDTWQEYQPLNRDVPLAM